MPESQLNDQDERDLVALADGSLSGRRLQAIEARLEESPDLRKALDRQRAGVAALRGLELAAPASLRTSIRAETAAPSAAVRRRRLVIGGVLAGAAAAIVLAAVLVLPSGAGGPSVVEAAKLSELPATAPAPPDPADPRLLTASAEGLPYPNLALEFGWRPAGQRSDKIDGREATTVFYERDGKRIGYTILSGDAIDPPDDHREVTLNDVELYAVPDETQSVVTWLRDGTTCVMAGKGVSEEELLTLAAWKGDGAVPF